MLDFSIIVLVPKRKPIPYILVISTLRPTIFMYVLVPMDLHHLLHLVKVLHMRAEMDQKENERTYAELMKPFSKVRDFIKTLA